MVKKYREKTCPNCGAKHNKRGPYCSRECGNAKRNWTKENREAVSAGLRKWHSTSDTAAVVAHNFISQGKHKEPDPVAPITRRDNLENNQFVQDGDLWTEI